MPGLMWYQMKRLFLHPELASDRFLKICCSVHPEVASNDVYMHLEVACNGVYMQLRSLLKMYACILSLLLMVYTCMLRVPFFMMYTCILKFL